MIAAGELPHEDQQSLRRGGTIEPIGQIQRHSPRHADATTQQHPERVRRKPGWPGWHRRPVSDGLAASKQLRPSGRPGGVSLAPSNNVEVAVARGDPHVRQETLRQFQRSEARDFDHLLRAGEFGKG